MKRSPIKKRRTEPRRGEPTKEEKEAARTLCYSRALGLCHWCRRYAPLNGDDFTRGQLCHLKAKRRFGWMESEETGQKHLWGCLECHSKSHNAGGKPCPAK